MKAWRVELTAGGKSLDEAKIQRGIFQGDALSPYFENTQPDTNSVDRKKRSIPLINSNYLQRMKKNWKL